MSNILLAEFYITCHIFIVKIFNSYWLFDYILCRLLIEQNSRRYINSELKQNWEIAIQTVKLIKNMKIYILFSQSEKLLY